MIEFCSNLSILGGDPLIGSAMTAHRVLFITWPREHWAERELQSKNFPEDLAAYLKRVQKEHGVMINLAFRRDESAHVHKVFLMPEQLVVSNVPQGELRRVVGDLIEHPEKLNDYQLERLQVPSMFVCTHGQRDRCCAKFGYGVFRAAEELRSKRNLGLQNWECTHLGGDRFAANVFAFPWFHMYGHVRAEHAGDLVEAVLTGRVYAPLYRGSMKLRGYMQLAEAFAQRYCFDHGLDANIELLSSEELPNNSARVIVRVAAGHSTEIDLLCTRKEFVVAVDCQQLDQGKRRTVTRWVIEQQAIYPN